MNNKTIEFFKEISKIPRETGNEKEISNFVVEFAKKRNLEVIQDEYNNVIIKKYYKDTEPIILQAHLDMVCEKDSNKEFDFESDPIEIIEEDGFLKANGTTLGADNGIGIAQILNILDSDIKRSIEAVFTVEEETTMMGASNIDLSSLKGTKLINLDGFDENTILVESASFTDIDIHTNYEFKEKENTFYEISINNLPGGHSGFDINKNIDNAIKMLVSILKDIKDIKIASLNGGSKINVIPSYAKAIIYTNERINIKNEKVNINELSTTLPTLSNEDSIRLLNSLDNLDHGVYRKNKRDEVTTSWNFATLSIKNNLIQIGLRSSIEEERNEALEYLNNYSNTYNYNLDIIGYQPGFRTMEDDDLVKDMMKSFYKINNSYPVIESVHIGVEVGLLKEKINNLKAIIISPLIIGAHTTEERVSIESVIKCDKWLYEYLTK